MTGRKEICRWRFNMKLERVLDPSKQNKHWFADLRRMSETLRPACLIPVVDTEVEFR